MKQGANNIFNLNNQAAMRSNESNIEYDLDIVDNNDGSYAKVTLEGIFYVNGVQANFMASNDMVKKSIINGNETLYIGTLSGTCTIDGIEREIIVSFEKSEHNLYLAFSINKLNSQEGVALIQFGNSILTNEIYNNLFNKDNNDDLISPMANYDYVDVDWEEIDNNKTNHTVIKGELHVQDILTEGSNTGKILSKFLYDSEALLEEFDVSQSEYRFEDTECMNLYVTYYSDDKESYFTTHHPDEKAAPHDIGTWVANALYDVGLPSLGLSTLAELIGDANDSIAIRYANDMYRRKIIINLAGEEFMDWADDPDGGYATQIAVVTYDTTDDDISVHGDMELGFRMFDKYTNTYVGWASVITQEARLRVDLSKYK